MKKSPSSISPVGKKLVQARLPFKTVTASTKPSVPPSSSTSTPTELSRKRKLSAVLADNNRPAKVNKIDDAKENVLTSYEVIDLDEDLSSKDTSVSLLSESDDPKTPAQKTSARKVATPANGSARKTPKAKKTPTPKRNTPKSTSKRKATSPVVILDDDDDGPKTNDTTPANFAIKLPAPKKSTVSDKTPTRAKRGKSVLETSISQDDAPSDIPIKLKSPSPKNSTTPKKSPAKPIIKTTPVAAKKSQSSTPKESPASTKKSPFTIKRRSRNLNVDKDKSVVESPSSVKSSNISASNANGPSDQVNLTTKVIDENSDSNSIILVGELPTGSQSTDTLTTTSISTPNKQQLPLVSNASASKLTPKQLQQKLEAENRLKEKLRLKEERERKAAEELERKKKEREEKEEQRRQEKEEKEKEREEKKRKEREDREKKRLEEIEAKTEDRKRKEEQREQERKRKEEQKEEERKKKEEEKTAKEEADKEKNRKKAEAFTKFFVKSTPKPVGSTPVVDHTEVECRMNFMPFRVKEDMKLAPMVRRVFSDNHRRNFDSKVLSSHSTSKNEDLYVNQLKTGFTKPGRSGKTWVNNDSDVLIVDDELEGAASVIDEPEIKQKFRTKLFKFHENRRPAYYGTWRKTSSSITARRPFGQDVKYFDYEVDSDDEWEEEEPGESLHGSDDEKDKESDDEYDIDNEFFVPHGHLSDEEVMGDDEEADDEDNSPETQKAKLKIVQMEFADEMKKKTQKIKPRLIGLIWQQPDGSLPPSCATVIADMLRSRAMVFQGPTIKLQKETQVENVADDEANDEVKASVSKRKVMSDTEVSDLIRLIHGSVFGKASLVREFQCYLRKKDITFSNAAILSRFGELATYKPCPDEGELMGKHCWYVSQECRQQYGLSELSIPNTWSYVLVNLKDRKAKANSEKKVKPEITPALNSEEAKPNKPKFNIANFTKVLSDEEKQKQFKKAETPTPTKVLPANTTPVSTSKPAQVVKKRVNLLMSVPRGQQIHTPTKNALISNFLKHSTEPTAEVNKSVETIEIE